MKTTSKPKFSNTGNTFLKFFPLIIEKSDPSILIELVNLIFSKSSILKLSNSTFSGVNEYILSEIFLKTGAATVDPYYPLLLFGLWITTIHEYLGLSAGK